MRIVSSSYVEQSSHKNYNYAVYQSSEAIFNDPPYLEVFMHTNETSIIDASVLDTT